MTRLFSGAVVDYVALWNGAPWDFDLRDVVVSLSRLPRYLGHTRRPISVLEHSALVSSIAIEIAMDMGEPVVAPARAGLVHDFPEAVIGDLPAGLRDFLADAGGDVLGRLEEHLLCEVFERFAIARSPSVERIWRAADLRARTIEMRALTSWGVEPDGPPTIADVRRECIDEVDARAIWLNQAVALHLITPEVADELVNMP